MKLSRKLTIAQKVGLWYSVLIVMLLLAGASVFFVLQKVRSIDNQVSNIIAPTLNTFKECRLMLKQSVKLTNDWVYQPSLARQEELNKLLTEAYSTHTTEVQRLKALWADGRLLELTASMDEKVLTLFAHEKEIMNLLNSPEAYGSDIAIEKAITILDNDIVKAASEIETLVSHIIKSEEGKSNELLEYKFTTFDVVEWAIVILCSFCALVGVVAARYAMQSVNNPLGNLKAVLNKLSRGILPEGGSSDDHDEIGGMLNGLVDGLRKTTSFANEIGKGNLDAKYEALSEGDTLGHSLIAMRSNLKKSAEEDKRRNWATQGLAEIGILLRQQTTNTEELYDSIIRFIVKYTKSNQGGMFLLNDDDPNNRHLSLVSCYAYERKKFLQRNIEVGEGMIGQCILEGQTTLLLDVPKDYVRITSGLGDATPNCVLIIPLKVNDTINGVLELACFNKFEDYEIKLVEKFAENISATISTVRTNERTRQLLTATQQQAEEMRSQEEEMRQNMEELSATQEEMARKEKEYLSKINDLEIKFHNTNSFSPIYN